MKKLLLSLLLFCTISAFGQVQPIDDGKLISDLDGNDQNITGLGGITVGAGSGTGAITLFPNLSPTTAAFGIQLGPDIFLYRSATGVMTLDGDLVVTGGISGGGSPVQLGSNQIWTGTNTFNGAVSMGSSLATSNSGITFTTTGAQVTRDSLGVEIGADVQAYNTNLATIAAFTPSTGDVLVGGSGVWTKQNGSTLRSSIGLGSASAVSFGSIASAGSITAGGDITAGSFKMDGGAVTIYTEDDYVVTDQIIAGYAGFRTPANLTIYNNSGTIVMGTTGDVILSRAGSGILGVNGSIQAAGLTLTGGAKLGVAYGGTGLDLSAITAGNMLYTSSTGVLATGAITLQGRNILAANDPTALYTVIGAGTVITKNVPVSGNAGTTQVVMGNDTRLSDSRAPSGAAGGSLSGSYPNPTIAASGVTPGAYGGASSVPVLTIGADGRVTAITTAAVSASSSPTGSAGGDLTGLYPNPTIAPNAVELGTDTEGTYLSGLTAGTGISVTGTPGEGWTGTIATVQNIATTASPTFVNLTLTGDLSVAGEIAFDSLGVDELILSGTVEGLDSAKTIFVAAGQDGATDTRSGITKYDINRPFSTLNAAASAAASGDTIRVLPASAAYTLSSSLPAGVVLWISEGAEITSVSMSTTGTSYILGGGRINNTSGSGLSVTGAGTILYCDVRVKASATAVAISAGELHLYKPVESTQSGASTVVNATGGTLYLHQGTELWNSISTTHTGLGGSGATIIVTGQVTTNGSVAGTLTPTVLGGSLLSRTKLFLADSLTMQSSAITTTGNLTVDGDLTVGGSLSLSSLVLGTPLPVTSGGTGASTATGARAALGLAIGSNIQAYDSDLATIAALTPTTDNFLVAASSAWASRTPSQARTSLGLVIGTDVQAWDADLDALANQAPSNGSTFVRSGGTWTTQTSAELRATLKPTHISYNSSQNPVSNADQLIEISNSSSGTYQLPDASEYGEGYIITFKQSGNITSGQSSTILPASGDNIDGSNSYVMTQQYESVTLQAEDNSSWHVIGIALPRPVKGWDAVGTSPETLSANIEYFEVSAGTYTLTLPLANTCPTTHTIVLKINSTMSGTNVVTIAPGGSDTIDSRSGSVYLRRSFESITLRRDPTTTTNWFVLDRYTQYEGEVVGSSGSTTVSLDGGTNWNTFARCDGILFTSNSAIAVTLPGPSATGLSSGFKQWYRAAGNGTITLTPASGTINGQASQTITGGTAGDGQGNAMTVYFDGTNWFTIAK